MKTMNHLLFATLILLVATSCHKDKDKPTEPEAEFTFNLTYTHGDVVDEPLADGDTIVLDMVDSFDLHVDIDTELPLLEYSVDYDSKFFGFTDRGNYNYRFTNNGNGVSSVSVFALVREGDLEPDEEAFYYTTIITKVPVTTYSVYSLTLPTYTIDVADESLKNEITTDLDANYSLLYRWLNLTVTSTTGGTYTLKTPTGEGSGTFTTDNYLDPTNFSFTYNNRAYSYVKTTIPGNSVKCNYTQDLTSYYQAKYPGKSINTVSLTFRGIWNRSVK
ncbi:MAG: hypothetical protein ACK5JD_04800 [Mangrovibacterium sp.]